MTIVAIAGVTAKPSGIRGCCPFSVSRHGEVSPPGLASVTREQQGKEFEGMNDCLASQIVEWRTDDVEVDVHSCGCLRFVQSIVGWSGGIRDVGVVVGASRLPACWGAGGRL